MVVWFALPGAVIDMAEDAESQFGILVEDFAVGHAILQMRGDKILVLQYLLDQRADLLVALDAGVRREDAMTLVGKLLKRIHRMNSTVRDLLTAYRHSISGTTNLATSDSAAFDDVVPVVDIAVHRVDHHVLNADCLIGGEPLAQFTRVLAVPVRAHRDR